MPSSSQNRPSQRKQGTAKSPQAQARRGSHSAQRPAKRASSSTATGKRGPAKRKTAASSSEPPQITQTMGYSGSQRTNTLLDTRKLARNAAREDAKRTATETSRRNRQKLGGQHPRATDGPRAKSAGKSLRGGQATTSSRRGRNAAAARKAAPKTTHVDSSAALGGLPGTGVLSGMSSGSKARLPIKAPTILLAILVVLAIIAFVILSNPKIYSGVHVGDVDVSGLTQEEASAKISEYYTPRLQAASVTVYAGEKGRETAQTGEVVPPAEVGQYAYTDEDGTTCYWLVNQSILGAYLDADAYAEAAYETGRDDGGFLTRLGSLLFGTTIDVACSYNAVQLEAFATIVDSALGEPRVDWDIQVVNGQASTVAGKDGIMANRELLSSEFSQAFLSEGSSSAAFTATVETAPVRIDEEQAASVASLVTDAIADGATFTYGSDTWSDTAATVGTWVTTSVAQQGTSWKLVPSLDPTAFSSDFFAHVTVAKSSDNLQVSFTESADVITVHTNGQGSIPQVSQARTDLESALFSGSGAQNDGVAASVTVANGPMPETLTFEEAVEAKVIEEVSSYTTTFSTYSGTEARNANIAIGASYINNTICVAGGDDWSFNDIVGDTTPDKGYQAAGSIAAGEYVDTYGGGICQVATTLFNALFESPYKIVKRYNHSLYIASYPTGRDAAIAWGMLDLTWRNESSSDVLVRASTDENSLTVSLYSVPIEYTVRQETGEWEEGDKYSITVQYDENLAKGTSYVKQSGTDGSKITVVRYVYDENGALMYMNTFASTYKAKDEIIVAGPGTEVDTKRTDTEESKTS